MLAFLDTSSMGDYDETDRMQSGYHGTIDVAFHDDVAVMTLDCGENRFNDSFLKKFNAALDTVLENKNTKALITTGKGKFFSNGIDLGWLNNVLPKNPTKVEKFRHDRRELVKRLILFPLPTVCAINGHAFAMGAVVTLLHDHSIMTTGRGLWSLNEVHIGIRMQPFVLEIIRAKLSGAMHGATVLGRRYTGHEAKSAGIVQDACAPEDLVPRCVDWVRRTVPKGGYNRDSLQTMKKDVYGKFLELPNLPNNVRGKL